MLGNLLVVSNTLAPSRLIWESFHCHLTSIASLHLLCKNNRAEEAGSMIAWFRTLHVAAEKRCFPPNSLLQLLDCQAALQQKHQRCLQTEAQSWRVKTNSAVKIRGWMMAHLLHYSAPVTEVNVWGLAQNRPTRSLATKSVYQGTRHKIWTMRQIIRSKVTNAHFFYIHSNFALQDHEWAFFIWKYHVHRTIKLTLITS
jgi:hypothetical protein